MEQEIHCPTGLELRRKIGGGRTNRCFRGTYQGNSVFAKLNDNAQEGILEKEADMLHFLRLHGMKVPLTVFSSPHCLILEFLKLDNSACHIPQLATEIGTLHRNNPSDMCGFKIDNFHGPLTVDNDWEANWVVFFKETRWKVLMERMIALGKEETCALADKICGIMELLFPNRPYICLLHGDFHHNNWGYCDGSVYLFDPLPLYGHNEYDLASLDCYVRPKEAFDEVYFSHVPKDEEMFHARKGLYHSFFRMIGYLLTGDEEHLRRANENMKSLLLLVSSSTSTPAATSSSTIG